ncbi:TetR family transcriptional regulator [Sphaerotilus hippei]|uniref:TetR family transcriptional regulator n=1 Tax=Sphaerotilus hippei TaxID=744406 RepID=A0A318GXZ2_9BURK|nr:TetR family transcriptional regulator [Sphaerotilus hippei]PXW94529.1 TetR family transcriptional regulator [Sphaerotilus hippei]
MARRTKEEAAATRERLLDTAEAVFLEHGVTRATLQDIATAAGVTRGAIYWHFKDKAELFIAMMDRATMPCEAVTRAEQMPEQADPLQLLFELTMTPLRALRDDERTRRVFTIAIHRTEYSADMQSAQQRQLDCINGYIADISALLRIARERGRIRDDFDIESGARGLFALVDGLLSQATLNLSPDQAVLTGQHALRFYLDGMRAR